MDEENAYPGLFLIDKKQAPVLAFTRRLRASPSQLPTLSVSSPTATLQPPSDFPDEPCICIPETLKQLLPYTHI